MVGTYCKWLMCSCGVITAKTFNFLSYIIIIASLSQGSRSMTFRLFRANTCRTRSKIRIRNFSYFKAWHVFVSVGPNRWGRVGRSMRELFWSFPFSDDSMRWWKTISRCEEWEILNLSWRRSYGVYHCPVPTTNCFDIDAGLTNWRVAIQVYWGIPVYWSIFCQGDQASLYQ